VQAGRQEDRIRGREQQVVEVTAAGVQDPVPFVVVEDRAPALPEVATRAIVDHDQPRAADVALEAPHLAEAVGVDPLHELAQGGGAVAGSAYRVVFLVALELGGGEIADVLVDPVRH
jgi:hypothetical protein